MPASTDQQSAERQARSPVASLREPAASPHPTQVGNYGNARWSRTAPAVAATAVSASGVGALVQIGHARAEGQQDVSVTRGDFDCLVMTGPNIHAWIDDRPMHMGPGGMGLYFQAGQASRWICDPTSREIVHLHIPSSMRADFLADNGTSRREARR